VPELSSSVVTVCTRSEPCARCRDQRDPGTVHHSLPDAPGPVGVWLLDGWWQHAAVRWPMRGLQYELGTRVVGEFRRRPVVCRDVLAGCSPPGERTRVAVVRTPNAPDTTPQATTGSEQT
jgi:hypothetical protein